MLKKQDDLKFAVNLIIYLLYIIIIPIIMYDVFLIAQTIVKPGVTPDLFGYKTFTIISGSMEPTINIDDIVIVKTVDRFDIQIDDIITFKIDEEIVTHRVIDFKVINNDVIYVTKGDSNEVTDMQDVRYENIEGKYIKKIPKAGKILLALKNKYVFSLILILLIICYILQKKNIQKKIKRKEKRKEYERKKETFLETEEEKKNLTL